MDVGQRQDPLDIREARDLLQPLEDRRRDALAESDAGEFPRGKVRIGCDTPGSRPQPESVRGGTIRFRHPAPLDQTEAGWRCGDWLHE